MFGLLIFNNILADKKYKPKDHTSELFNKNDICSRLLDLFINFEVKDLYYDLQEIVNSFKNLDKKEIYLYFGEIEVEKRRFPLFYSQINVKEYSTESVFKISFSNEFFVNKRAIDFAFQTLLKEDKKVETKNNEKSTKTIQELDREKLENKFSKGKKESLEVVGIFIQVLVTRWFI